VHIEGTEVHSINQLSDAEAQALLDSPPADGVLDARHCLVTPGFVDAHTHLFPPTDRSAEFAMRPISR